MRMYFQTESVARRFAQRSEAVSGRVCATLPYGNGWKVLVTGFFANQPAYRPGQLPVMRPWCLA